MFGWIRAVAMQWMWNNPEKVDRMYARLREREILREERRALREARKCVHLTRRNERKQP